MVLLTRPHPPDAAEVVRPKDVPEMIERPPDFRTEDAASRAGAGPARFPRTGGPSAATGARPEMRAVLLGLPDRGDVELEGHRLADQDAAALQHGIPGGAPVLAVDACPAPEFDPDKAPGVGFGAVEPERHGYRLGDATQGEVSGGGEFCPVDLLDLGCAELDGRVVGDIKELGAQVIVAASVTGIDALGPDVSWAVEFRR